MLDPWENYRKPDGKLARSHPAVLAGMWMWSLTLFLKKDRLESGKVQRNAIKGKREHG